MPNESDAAFLVMTAERDALMAMLEGTATVAMLVLSGAIHVDDWENALLFQEAFDFDPKAYAKWKEEQRYLLLRPRHSDEPTQLAGGADLDEDVEASLQHVIAERARQARRRGERLRAVVTFCRPVDFRSFCLFFYRFLRCAWL